MAMGIFQAFCALALVTLCTSFIAGPGGPCSNCPQGWWCCGNKDECFNPSTFMCCNDNATATCGARSLCCGESCFDADEEMCCGGDTVTKRCGDNSWCCGSECYDPDKQHCCDGQLFTCPPNHICCGRGCYDPDTHVCCNRVIVEKCATETGCCGEECYDSAIGRCDIVDGQFVVHRRFFRPNFIIP